jgi:hypothetical protein
MNKEKELQTNPKAGLVDNPGEHRCPKCRSSRVKIGYPNIDCLACGWSEPLIDFPISWDWHRHYRQEFGLPDPGPCQLEEHPELEAMVERLQSIEQMLNRLSEEDLRQLRIRSLYDRVQGLERGLALTQRAMARSMRTTMPRKVVRGVPL